MHVLHFSTIKSVQWKKQTWQLTHFRSISNLEVSVQIEMQKIMECKVRIWGFFLRDICMKRPLNISSSKVESNLLSLKGRWEINSLGRFPVCVRAWRRWSVCTVRPLQMCCLCLLERQIIVCLDNFLGLRVPRLSWQLSVHLGSTGISLMFSPCLSRGHMVACAPWCSLPLAPHMHPGEFNHLPCMGAKMTGEVKMYLLYLLAQRAQFSKNDTPQNWFALINESRCFWQWQVRKYCYYHNKQHRRNSFLNLHFYF